MEKKTDLNQGHFDFFLLFDLEVDFFAFATIRVSFLCAIKHADSEVL
jgi:hypothetical protein